MWYRTGLVNVTNNSTAVVGVGTSWITGASVGEVFVGPDGKTYEIADILSATSLTLGSVYLGSTISGQTYQIIPTQSYMRDLAAEVSELVSNYGTAMTSAGAGKFGDGTLSLPGVAFTADTNTGLHRTGSDAFSAVAGGSAAASFTASGTELKTGSTVNSVPIVGTTTTQTLTNKTIDLTSNTLVATSAQLKAALTDETGSGSAVFATSPTLVTPVLGTPASGTLTNCTGLPVASGISGLGTGVATFLATPSSANLATALTNESGSGTIAMTDSPIFTGVPSAPTAIANAISGQIANAEFVQREKEIVSGKSQILHQGTIVASCIDLPSKHSDGGAWIDRCQDKSWYNETLGGDRWIGQQATVAAAWTAAGDATGAVFQASATAGPLTIGKFYTATSSSAATEVWRGIKREYPRAGVAWIAESGRVVGYDLGSGAMWKSLKDLGALDGIGISAYLITSVATTDGKVIVGVGGSSGDGVKIFDFLNDFSTQTTTNFVVVKWHTLTLPNKAWQTIPGSAIVNNIVNSVAITVLPNAPIDPGTGLPVPTIAVATAGGVSVILDSGSVNNITYGGLAVGAVAFDPSNKLIASLSGYSEYWELPYPYQASTASPPTGSTVYTSGSTPSYRTDTNKKIALNAFGGSTGLGVTKENPTTPASGMVAYVTEKYNTGWQVGAIKAAICADTATTIADKSVKARTVTSTTLVIAAVASGAGLNSFKDSAGNIACTLDATVANGCHIWWEYVAGVWTLYASVVSAGGASTATGYINGAGSVAVPITNVVVAGGTGVTILQDVIVANVRFSATLVSSDQIAQIYRDELPLFQANAQCTLAGTSPAITALSFDEDTGVLHAGTSYGRSSFKGLLRVESEATTVGSPTSIAASGGHIVMGGTSAKLYTPAKYLRDELQRQSEAKKALGRIPVFLDITATSGQTAFVATKGYRIQAVYKGGTLMRESTTGTYWTRSNDGYQETATLSVGATTGDWVSLMLVRV